MLFFVIIMFSWSVGKICHLCEGNSKAFKKIIANFCDTLLSAQNIKDSARFQFLAPQCRKPGTSYAFWAFPVEIPSGHFVEIL